MRHVVNQADNKSTPIPLIQLLERAQRWFVARIVEELKNEDSKNIQPSDLKLLANLDCGTTYASEVAKRMGVSRQSVNKSLKNLVSERMVTLETHPNQRNTKLIVMTPEGREWVKKAVAVSSRLEREVAEKIGSGNATALRRALEAAWPSWNES